MPDNHAQDAAQAVERQVESAVQAEMPAGELSKEKLDSVTGGEITWRDVCDAFGIPNLE